VRAEARGHAFDQGQILDRDRNAVEGAASAVTAQNALTFGFTCSMRSSTARVSSTGESAFDRIWGMSSVAGV
jgi:hypothetical protein